MCGSAFSLYAQYLLHMPSRIVWNANELHWRHSLRSVEGTDLSQH